MCGIVGFIGKKAEAVPFLIQGLHKLEYRGYDSAGVSLVNGTVNVVKSTGKVKMLEDKLSGLHLCAQVGIGHTRWATHGAPCDANSHPHTDGRNNISVVHNGIIENYLSLKEFLQKNKFKFRSQTDTEVIPHLIDYHYKGDLLAAVREAVSEIRGSYAFLVTSALEPDRIIAVRKDSPMVIGMGDHENYIASDVMALVEKTRDFIIMEDNEIALVRDDSVEVYGIDGRRVDKKVGRVSWDVGRIEKNGYGSFMEKEIHEQPTVIGNTFNSCVAPGVPVRIPGLRMPKAFIKAMDRVHIVACGTASYAGMAGRRAIEELCGIPVEVSVASEFRYSDPVLSKKSLALFISQSGETADTIAALKLARERGLKTMVITNVIGSSITREADYVVHTVAGPEIAVASTKAYTSQIATLQLLALYFAQARGTVPEDRLEEVKQGMLGLSVRMKQVLKLDDAVRKCARKYKGAGHMFYIGRGIDYALAQEGALKLKEISYIHAESFPAGELKHGSIALLEEGTPVVAICTQPRLQEKMLSNIKEVKARGARVIAICTEGLSDIGDSVDDLLVVPSSEEMLMPELAALPLQLFAYHMANELGRDVDKPRNLAKSVTVE